MSNATTSGGLWCVLSARRHVRHMSVKRATGSVGSMCSFPMTPMKPLSEIAYVPNSVVRSVGSDSDDLETPVVQQRGCRCRPSPWWAIGGLIATVVVLIVVVFAIESHAAPSEASEGDRGNVGLVAGGLLASVGAAAASTPPPPSATVPTAYKSDVVATPTPEPATVDPLGVVESAVTSVAARSARISLSNVIRHALGTYAVEIDVVASVHDYETYATAPGSRVVLRMHGEMVALAKSTTVAEGSAAAADLYAALDPQSKSASFDAANQAACVSDADRGELVHGVYVRTVCVDGAVVPHSRRPSLRCYVVLESACFAPGRSRLPQSVQYDSHNAPWVFSYTSTSTYVRRRR